MSGRSQTLTVVISGDASQLNRAFAKAEKGGAALERGIGKASTGIGRSMATAGKVVTAAIGVGVVAALKKSVDAFSEAEGIATQTNVVLKSTGGIAKVTAKDVGELATSISRKSGIDDEAIQSAENLLLTFTKVRNETGKNNDIFNRATQTVADFSVRFKKDLGPSAILVGKALNDPIKGISALSRVGVQFTKGQKEQITALVESGKTLEAQKLILAELETQTKGAADAAGDTFAGKMNKAEVAVGNLGESVGGLVVPALGDLAEGAAGVVDALATSDRPAKFFDGFADAAGAAKDAVAGVFSSIADKRAGGATLGKAIGDTFADAVSDVDWSGVGDKIADGIGGAIEVSGDVAGQVEDGLGAALSDVDGRKLLGGLLRVVSEGISAVFSPSFWGENFKNIFATVTIAIPVAKILKIPGAGALYNFISRPFFSAVGKLGTGLANLARDAAGAGVKGLVSELSRGAGAAGAATRLVGRIGKGIGDLPGIFRRDASLAMGLLRKGIVDGTGAAGAAAGRVVTRITGALGRGASAFFRAGWDVAKSILNGIVRGITAGIGAVGGAIKKGVGAVAGFVGIGDGIGRALGKNVTPAPPPGGGAGGGLKGANPALGPFAGIAGRFGLHVSSGMAGRQNKLTSSGNVSYHSSGEAIDIANGRGPDADKLRFFNYMKANHGAQLAELIYTPGGAGIKNGGAYTYTGKVAADHYDHVHVALDLGRPGPGIGDGIGTAVSAARAAGFSGTELVNMVAIAARESGYNPRAQNLVPPDHSIGLWQINQLAHKGRFGTDAELMNPTTNAKAARALFKASGYGPWGGAGVSPFHNVTKSMFAAARAAVTGVQGAASTSGGGGAPAAASDDGEKQGSRIVNAIANTFFKDSPSRQNTAGRQGKAGGGLGITSLTKFAAGRERVIGEKDTEYAQAVRRFDQSEEDLGTAGGREKRLSELAELKKLKAAQLKRLQAEKKALEAAAQKYAGLIKALRAKLKGKKAVRGAAAARIRKRIRDYDDARIEKLAAARALGSTITDTQLDLGDLDVESAEVSATPDTTDTAAGAGVGVTDGGAAAADRGSRAGSALALAQLTKGTGDDVQALGGVLADKIAAWQEEIQVAGHGTAEVAAAWVDVATAIKSYEDAVRDNALEPFREGIATLNDDLIRAQVDTPDDKKDDIAVVTAQLAQATAGYEAAIRQGNEEAIVDFGSQVLGLRESLKGLQDATDANTAGLEAEMKGLREEMARANAIASSEWGIGLREARRVVADMVSGELGARRGPRALMPGSGELSRL